ncbi:hypothetical protein GCM10010124_21790 [Pilimelia terevasa]|uniref:Uncharacterized protein n=1 Tax=Pilimelia terevasa TaxID=53372 RepID=A0A8J3BP77_9ACTN|nr:hypothetical protein [Pilimelia terevasa]GGK28730.1 hypothetical protein GCM10010124_21790 [Pilimelia terevasa]
MIFFRRRLPADRRPALARDERVVAWAAAADAATVVVTNLGLYLPGAAERLDWHRILKATWDERALTVTAAREGAARDGYAVVADDVPRRYALADPGDVPHQVRTRVTGSVGYTVHGAVPGGGARVAGRRVAGADGLVWTVRYDPGTPADDPQVVAATDALVAAARASATPTDL